LQRQLLLLDGLPGILDFHTEDLDLPRSGGPLHVLIVPSEREALDIVGDKLPDGRVAPLRGRHCPRRSGRGRSTHDGVLGGHVPCGDLAGVGVVAVVVRSPLVLGSLPSLELLVVPAELRLVVGPVRLIGVVSALAQVAVAGRQEVVGGRARDPDVVNRGGTASVPDRHVEASRADHRSIPGEIAVVVALHPKEGLA